MASFNEALQQTNQQLAQLGQSYLDGDLQRPEFRQQRRELICSVFGISAPNVPPGHDSDVIKVLAVFDGRHSHRLRLQRWLRSDLLALGRCRGRARPRQPAYTPVFSSFTTRPTTLHLERHPQRVV